MWQGDAEFEDFMILAEFMCWITAKNSALGFEKALELICKGATDWKQQDEC